MVAALAIAGQKFGRLTAIDRVGSTKHGKTLWSFLCDCGQVKCTTASLVIRGSIQSCGCLLREQCAVNGRTGASKIAASKTTHGHSRAKSTTYLPEYGTWKCMRQRCSNPKNADFPAYGGRGIRVCARWDHFENFLADMGRRPGPRYSIDRIDTNGHYEPGNCRWADDVQQANNRRPRGTGEYATQQEH